jgi:hypothetical protein
MTDRLLFLDYLEGSEEATTMFTAVANKDESFTREWVRHKLESLRERK